MPKYLDRTKVIHELNLFVLETKNGFEVKHYGRDSRNSTKKTWKTISPVIRTNGNKTYIRYRYVEDGKIHSIYAHRLFYAFFIGPIREGFEVDHINNDSLDNRLENLQLLTATENRHKQRNDRLLKEKSNGN